MTPILGARLAELSEMPVMLFATALAARWIIARRETAISMALAGCIGLIGLTLMLVAELGVLYLVRGESMSQNISSRDPISGMGYLLALLFYAVAPAFAALLAPPRGRRSD